MAVFQRANEQLWRATVASSVDTHKDVVFTPEIEVSACQTLLSWRTRRSYDTSLRWVRPLHVQLHVTARRRAVGHHWVSHRATRAVISPCHAANRSMNANKADGHYLLQLSYGRGKWPQRHVSVPKTVTDFCLLNSIRPCVVDRASCPTASMKLGALRNMHSPSRHGA